MEHHIDDIRSWMVLVAGICLMTTFVGVFRSSGVIFVNIMKEFNVSRDTASIPLIIQLLLVYFGGSVLGIAGKIFNVRVTLVFAIIVSALFTCLAYFASDIYFICVALGVANGICGAPTIFYAILVPNQYFVKNRAIANGILFCGISIGSVAFPPLIQTLIDTFGFYQSFFFVGGIILANLPSAFLLKPQKIQQTPLQLKTDEPIVPKAIENVVGLDNNMDDSGTNCQNSERGGLECAINPVLNDDFGCSGKISTKNIQKYAIFMEFICFIKLPMLWIIMQTFVFVFWISNTFAMVIIDHARDCNIDIHRSPYIVSAFSSAEIVGRLSFGLIRKAIPCKHIAKIGALLMGISYFILPLYGSLEFLVCNSLVMGACIGVILPAANVSFIEYMGLEKLALCIGVSYLYTSMMFLTCTFLIPYIRETFGSYTIVFYINGALALISASFWMLERWALNRKIKSTIDGKS